jgi:HK97 family phage major capsid protein
MSKTMKEMIAAHAILITQARAENDLITEKTSPGDQGEIEARFELIMSEAATLQTRIDNRSRLEAAEASVSAGDPRRPNGATEARGVEGEAEAIDYRGAFHAMLRAGGDVHSMDAEARSVLQQGVSSFSAEQRAQVVGTNTAGGFLVPDEAMQQIVIAMAAFGPMFADGFGTVIPSDSGGSMPIPGVDDIANEAAAEAAEGGDKGAGTDIVFTRKTLEDHLRTTGWLGVSIQLMTGSMAGVEQLIGGLLGERMGRKVNRELTVGSGSGEPVGIVTGASVGITTAGIAFTADEVLKFIHSVDPAYRQLPKFGLMFNDATSLALSLLKNGDGNYLLQLAPDGTQRLVIGNVAAKFTINQAMPDIGAETRPMIAGDMSKYYVRKIGGFVLGSDRGKEFWPGMGIAGYQRYDGVVADPRAIKAMVMPAS